MTDIKTPAEVNEEALARLVENLRSETIEQEDEVLRVPARLFVDPQRALDEIELFRRVPVIVGHHSELPEPGSFVTREVLGKPVILVRRDDGTVGGYLNICQHRGGRVEQEASGAKRVFACGYHGWSYNREDGALRNIPFASDFGEVDRACHGLQPVAVEERHGMLWLDLSNDPQRSVSSYLGADVEMQLSQFELELTTLFMEQHFDLPINWKIVMDGALDVLHVKFLHPNGVSKFLVTGRSVFMKRGRHGQNFTPRRRLERAVRDGEEIGDFWKFASGQVRMYPNAMCILAPDHIEFWTVWPTTDPARSTVHIRFLVRRDILDDNIAERITRSWELLRDAAVNEDFPMEETIQQNAAADPDGVFTYGRNETGVRHLHEWLEQDLATLAAGDRLAD